MPTEWAYAFATPEENQQARRAAITGDVQAMKAYAKQTADRVDDPQFNQHILQDLDYSEIPNRIDERTGRVVVQRPDGTEETLRWLLARGALSYVD